MVTQPTETGFEAAVIGMAGRFPGAGNIEEFWNNLMEGRETLSFFNDRELEASGQNPESFSNNEDYVRAKGIVEGSEYFDADFFDYTPQEAEQMDPQVRIFHECIWAALEDAGYDPYTYDGLIGLYAGATDNIPWQSRVFYSGYGSASEGLSSSNLANKDFLSTQISYKLNLRGPSTTLANACSTSLVAAHLAYQGLISGECDIALTGGVSITIPIRSGYVYQEGMAFSQDGHNRTFAHNSSGTVFGNGVGVVVLKRYKDAIDDNDHIYALVKGSALNNDGNRKVGFTAPSVEGQAQVIQSALEMSEVEPESIRYIETHGTGTILGDPIEARALTRAFKHTTGKNFCALGSVKSNIGHLDAAAGVTGLIKTILVLKHRLIPPSLHFESPNPQIDFKNSPFYMNTRLSQWTRDLYPGRAGLSSFGIGGTNAHFILEEAPAVSKSVNQWVSESVRKGTAGREYQLILLSAKTETALEQMTQNLANHLKKNPGIHLADTAYTLQTGRRALNYRRILVCANVDEAIAALETPGQQPQQTQANIQTRTFLAKERKPYVVFMFSGLGSQYINMGWDLYRTEPLFRESMDQCFAVLQSLVGPVKEILYPGNDDSSSSRERNKNDKINHIFYSGLIKFSFDYSMAKLLMKWGISPGTMIGHSFGEYVAACLSGVFSLEDALKLVKARGEVLEKMSPGTMLSVPLSEEEIKPYIQESDDLSIAAVNSTLLCIVSGPPEAIANLDKKLQEKGCECVHLNVPRAGHSPMMDPFLPEFKECVCQIALHQPQIPYISCVTGKLITAEQTTDPEYWTRHMRETVRFADGIDELIKKPNAIFIQVGVGRGLTLYVDQHPGITPDHLTINLLRSHKEDISDVFYLLDKIGELWLWGKIINWQGFYPREKPHRIPLPTYPFAGRRYWKYVDQFQKKLDQLQDRDTRRLKKNKEMAQWFYVPTWERSIIEPAAFNTNSTNQGTIDGKEQSSQACWLVLIDNCGIGTGLLKKWELDTRERNRPIIRVNTGHEFKKVNDREFIINQAEDDHYSMLFDGLQQMGMLPGKILHLWGLTGNGQRQLDSGLIKESLDLGFYSLLHLVKQMGQRGMTHEVCIEVVTDHLQEVTGEESIQPEKSLVLGPVKVIPQEYANITCRSIDVVVPEPGTAHENRLLDLLATEFAASPRETVIAYRGNHRWVRSYKHVCLEETLESRFSLREKGVYLVTGGLGGIGLVLAQYLAKSSKDIRLILTGRSAFPPSGEWQKWLSPGKEKHPTSVKIKKLQEIETLGGQVLVCRADTANLEQMQEVVNRAEKQWGHIDGVIHSAGIVGGETIKLIDKIGKNDCTRQFQPKVHGLLVLETLFKHKPLDFCVLMSSMAAILGGLGFSAYSAANIFMDTFAQRMNLEGLTGWTSVNWDGWQIDDTMAPPSSSNIGATLAELSMTPEEGAKAFKRILGWCQAPQVLQSAGEVQGRIDKWIKLKSLRDREDSAADKNDTKKGDRSAEVYTKPRPNLSTPYEKPTTPVEERILGIWQRIFGFAKIGICDDFFEMGGDSLKAMMVSSQIQKTLKVRIPLTEYFKRSTIKNIADYIQKKKEGSDGRNEDTAIKPAETREYYPLSPAQRRLFILWQMDKAGIGYNETTAAQLQGELEKEKLENVFRKLIARHQGLRTSFQMINGQPVQEIHRQVEFEMEYFLATEDTEKKNYKLQIKNQKERSNTAQYPDPKSQELRAKSFISSFIRPFNLSRAPLLRVRIVTRGKNNHILVVDMPHIITDGVSQDILVKEFTALYAGEELKPSKLQYKDYACWPNSERGKKIISQQEAFWTNRFSGELPVLDLPADYKRPEVIRFEGNVFDFIMDRETTGNLKKLTAHQDVTIYMLFFAIYIVMLSKLSGQEDIIVGTVVAGRNYQNLENVMGMFVNTLALRAYPAHEKTFAGFLKELKKEILEVFENQDYPFEDLVEKVVKQRDPARNPLFDAAFTFQNVYSLQDREVEEIKKPGLQLKPHAYEKQSAKFDLLFHGYHQGDTISVGVEYSTNLFKKETIERFISYYRGIITAVLENIDTRLNDIDILTPGERSRLLSMFNRMKTVYPADKTLHRLFTQQAERTPDQMAIVVPSVSVGAIHEGAIHESPLQITYNQLNEKSNQLAGLLIEKGIQPDSIVAIMMERSLEMLTGMLGILKAGFAYLPIDPEYPTDRINYMLADSSAGVLVTTGLLAEEVEKVRRWEGERIFLEPGYFQGRGVPGGAPINVFSPASHQDVEFCQVGPANLAYIIYTSGTTGKPKGAMIQHYNVVRLMFNEKFQFDFGSDDVWTMFHSFCFDFSVWEMYGALLYGGKLIVVPKDTTKDPKAFRNLLKKNRVTVLNQTPSAFYNLITEEFNHESDTLGLSYVIFGGEALNPGKLANWREKYPKTRLINMYGITETTVHVTYKEITPAEIASGVSNIGTPIPTLSAYIVDKNGKLVPPGVIGELWVGGEGVCRGYLNRVDLTAEKFDHDLWDYRDYHDEKVKRVAGAGDNYINKKFFADVSRSRGQFLQKAPPYASRSRRQKIYKSGDLVRLTGAGEIEYLGRMDQQVQIRGYRVEMGEIENQLLKHAEIREAVVLASEPTPGSISLTAYLVAAGKDKQLSGAELRRYLSGLLPDYMIPPYFIQVDYIPLTSNGKVDRKSLPGPQSVRSNREKAYAAPRSQLEQTIARAWQEVLHLEKIGVNDHFFDIGGNSLNILQVNTKLKQVLGKELPLMILFRYTTIRSLAQFIGESKIKTRIEAQRTNRSETLQKGKTDRQQRYEKRKTRKTGTDAPGEQRARRNR